MPAGRGNPGPTVQAGRPVWGVPGPRGNGAGSRAGRFARTVWSKSSRRANRSASAGPRSATASCDSKFRVGKFFPVQLAGDALVSSATPGV